jgi:hypothetical protein
MSILALQHSDHPTTGKQHSSVQRPPLGRGNDRYVKGLHASDFWWATGTGKASTSAATTDFTDEGGRVKSKEDSTWGRLRSTQLISRALVMEAFRIKGKRCCFDQP